MKIVYLIFGFFFLGLGAVGAAIPLLPTVPFLLLASFFFAKGSRRMNDWFRSTGLYQKHLEHFVKNHAMTLKAKILILTPASCMIVLAFIFSKPLVARIFILAVLVLKYYYFIFKIKTTRNHAPRPASLETIVHPAAAAEPKQTKLP